MIVNREPGTIPAGSGKIPDVSGQAGNFVRGQQKNFSSVFRRFEDRSGSGGEETDVTEKNPAGQARQDFLELLFTAAAVGAAAAGAPLALDFLPGGQNEEDNSDKQDKTDNDILGH